MNREALIFMIIFVVSFTRIFNIYSYMSRIKAKADQNRFNILNEVGYK